MSFVFRRQLTAATFFVDRILRIQNCMLKKIHDRIDQRTALLLLGAGVLAGFAVLKQSWFYLVAMFGFFVIVLWPVQAALGGFAFVVPFDSYSALGTASNGTSLTFVAGVVAAMILVGLGIVLHRLQFPPKPALWWLLFILWAAASSLWAYNQEAAIRRLPTIFSLYLFYLVAASFRVNEREFSAVVRLTIWGGCAAALVSAYEFYHGTLFGGMRGSLILGDNVSDPNIFAAGLLLPFSLAVAEFIGARALLQKAFMLLACGMIALSLFLTMSRGALLAVAVMLLVYLRKLRMNWRVFVPAAVIAGALLVVPNLLFQRVEQSELTGGAGRVYVWQTGLAALKDFAFTGAGLNNFSSIYDRYANNAERFVGLHRAPHNIYLETGVELGIVGFALFLLAVVSQLRMASRAQPLLKRAPANLRIVACHAAAWGMLTASFFLGMLWFKSFWLVWIMLALASSERMAEQKVYVMYPAIDSSVAALH
jgi:O-antigen ligase